MDSRYVNVQPRPDPNKSAPSKQDRNRLIQIQRRTEGSTLPDSQPSGPFSGNKPPTHSHIVPKRRATAVACERCRQKKVRVCGALLNSAPTSAIEYTSDSLLLVLSCL